MAWHGTEVAALWMAYGQSEGLSIATGMQ